MPLKFIDVDPPYLKVTLEVPVYDTIQVVMSSLDFVVLENYAAYIHRWIRNANINMDNYAIPHTSKTVSIYIPKSTKVDEVITLNQYRRVINMHNLPTTKLPLILEVMLQQQPEGVRFTLDKPSEQLEEFRYIPELEKEVLHEQLKLLDQ